MRNFEKSTTTCGEEVTVNSPSGAPGPINPDTGQHTCYYVLKPEERAKGFIRPVRKSYVHWSTKDGSPFPVVVTASDLHNIDGCGAVTTMSQSIAETYARDPFYYGSTFCIKCKAHYPVGKDGEFIWDDGTNEKVGT